MFESHWQNHGPPIEAAPRHSEAASKTTMKLGEMDAENLPPQAIYKSMSMDIIEGHQIGLYHSDGSIKYPNHHTFASAGGQQGVNGIMRKRPASANPAGRQLSPSAVRDVMKVSDIDGAHPTCLQRQRTVSDNMKVSDLNQRRRSPSPRKVDPNTQLLQDRDRSPFEAYNEFHKHTSMHRPKDQSGQMPQRSRPWSAGVGGRAPYSDPLNPTYYVAAPTAHIEPHMQHGTLRDVLERNEQPAAYTNRRTGEPSFSPHQSVDDAVIGAANVVVSRPLYGKATPLATRNPGTYKKRTEQAKLLMREDDSVPEVWNKLQHTAIVNQRLNNTAVLRAALYGAREAAALAASHDPADSATISNATAVSEGTSYPVHLNPYLDYRDVPYGTSHWKLRMQENRSQRKEQQRVAAERKEVEETQRLSRALRPTRNLGPSACTTTTTQYTVTTQAYDDAFDRTAAAGSSPKKLVPDERRLADSQIVGVESCKDIAGTMADAAWKRPATSSSLQRRILRDVAAAKTSEQCAGVHAAVLTGSSSGIVRIGPTRGPQRPSSATVRSASTGAVSRDQVPVRSTSDPPFDPRDISTYAEAMTRHGVTFASSARPSSAVGKSTVNNMQSTKSRVVVRPPAHSADRREILHRKEVAEVRSLPNYV